jgi:hypothetical protein
MDGRTLERKMNYLGMEKCARKILVNEKISTVNEVAIMPSVEVCEKLLEEYEVVSCEDEKITIVKHENMKTYNSITKLLSR